MKFKCIFIIMIMALLMAAGCATNPISGKQQLMLISEEQDLELGKQYAPEIEKQLGGKIQNLELQNYVDMIGQRVSRVSHRADWDYHFTALEDETVNAFALPGGYIFITRGMLSKLENEAQLASVLAHETTHVVARHSSAQISREIGFEIALAAISTQASGTAMQAAGFARQMIGLGYSRGQEKEADMGGITYMVQAGYDPEEMAKTFEMLEREAEGAPPEFFSTHPNPGNRAQYIREKIYEMNYDKLKLKVGADDYKRSVLDNLNIK
jgi:predicted Zn-dependent protease